MPRTSDARCNTGHRSLMAGFPRRARGHAACTTRCPPWSPFIPPMSKTGRNRSGRSESQACWWGASRETGPAVSSQTAGEAVGNRVAQSITNLPLLAGLKLSLHLLQPGRKTAQPSFDDPGLVGRPVRFHVPKLFIKLTEQVQDVLFSGDFLAHRCQIVWCRLQEQNRNFNFRSLSAAHQAAS